MRGTSVETVSQVLQWLNYGATEVESAVASWVYPALSLVESAPHNVSKAKDDLRHIFHFLNEFLKTRTFLVGERLSLADVSLAADLLLAYQHVVDEAFRHPYANLNRWFNTVIHQTHVQSVLGEVKFCEKVPEYDAHRHNEHKKAAQKQKEAKPAEAKKEAKKAEPKPKPVEKPKEPEPELDETDEALAEEPKQTDPFAALPKGYLYFLQHINRILAMIRNLGHLSITNETNPKFKCVTIFE